MTEAEHVNTIIEIAKDRAKKHGEPLDNKHLAKYVAIDRDEFKERNSKLINKQSLLQHESDHPFWTILTWTFFGGIGFALPVGLVVVFLGEIFGITNTSLLVVVCAVISILLGLLAGSSVVEKENAELRQASFNSGMSWERDLALFEKALKKLDAE